MRIITADPQSFHLGFFILCQYSLLSCSFMLIKVSLDILEAIRLPYSRVQIETIPPQVCGIYPLSHSSIYSFEPYFFREGKNRSGRVTISKGVIFAKFRNATRVVNLSSKGTCTILSPLTLPDKATITKKPARRILSLFRTNIRSQNYFISLKWRSEQVIKKIEKIMFTSEQQNQFCDKLRAKVESLFRREGYLTYSNITRQACYAILNKEAQIVLGADFKTEILDDVWENCNQNSYGEVSVHKLGDTFVEAFRILHSKIEAIEDDKYGVLSDRYAVLKQKKRQLSLFEEQKNNRRVHCLKKTCEEMEAEIQSIQSDLQIFHEELRFIFFLLVDREGYRDLFSKNKKNRKKHHDHLPKIKTDTFHEEHSHKLLLILYLSAIMILVQLVMLIFDIRKSLLPLELGCLSIFILLFGYVSYHSGIQLFLALLISIIMDLLFVAGLLYCAMNACDNSSWICSCSGSFVPKIKQFTDILSIALFMGSCVVRVVMMGQWWQFRHPGKRSYYFNFCGEKVVLNKRLVVVRANQN